MTILENAPRENIKLPEKLGISTGYFACNIIYQTISTYLLFFYTNVFGLNAAVAATMFLVVRIIDAVANPVWGVMVDKMKAGKRGKYLQWLFFGAIPFTVLSILCFYSPSLSAMGKIIYAYVTYVAMSLAYIVVSLPTSSLPAAMTRNSDQITSLTSYSDFAANVAGMCVSFGVPLLVTKISGSYSGPQSQIGWLATMALYSIIGCLCFFYSVKVIHERYVLSSKEKDSVKISDLFTEFKTNKALVILALIFILSFGMQSIVNSTSSYFVTYNMNQPNMLKWFNLLGSLPSFVLIPMFPLFKKWFGKRGMLVIFFIIEIIGLGILYFGNAHNTALMMVGQLIKSCGMLVATGFIWALVPEVITYSEWVTGRRLNGVLTAVISFMLTFGMALGGVVPGYVLSATGFSAKLAVQTATAMGGIKTVMCTIPAVLVVITIICVLLYPLTDERLAKITAEINDRSKKNA
ncbi:transporter, major facilitator family protein [Limosilactobacillus secaliphilus]|uniref:Transporter, major facilitator family protein n=1 Tax=Limosilactobacillus secaliphilus TaxID=396268 RepID=A0A0R2IAY0_9LACO|nr:transporter, major facilitator family protein [Limosilactobacillus secaliphilus]